MSKTLLLLPGWPKTGTSALQGMLALNHAFLMRQGICYRPAPEELTPRAEEATAGNAFRLALQLHPHALPAERDRVIDEFLTQAQASATPWVIFASEAFVGATLENLSAFAEQCVNRGFEVKALFYLRSLPEFLLSQWRQRVKLHGEWRSPQEYVSRLQQPLRFVAAIRNFQSIWGKDLVMLRIYDRHAFPQGDIVQDFFQAVGLGVNPVELHPLPPQVNLSLNDWGTQVMRWVNEELRDPGLAGLFSRALLAVQPAAPSQGPSQELVDLIETRFQADLEFLKPLLPQWPLAVAAAPGPALLWTPSQEQQARALARSLKGVRGWQLKAAYRLGAWRLLAWLARRWLGFCLGDQAPQLKQP